MAADHPQSVSFQQGSFTGTERFTVIRNPEGAFVHYEKFPPLFFPNRRDHQISARKWRKLLRGLRWKCRIHTWEWEYINREISDGTQWKLILTYENGQTKEWVGINSYPPQWDKLVALFTALDSRKQIYS